MKARIIIYVPLLLIAFLFSVNPVYSCANHGPGFGGPPGSGFNRWHPYSPISAQGQAAQAKQRWLSLKTPSMVSAKLSEKIDISIDYQKLKTFDNVRFELELSPEIAIVNAKQTETDSESGQFVFSVIPNKTGTYRLVIVANASVEGSPQKMQKVVYLNSV